MEKRSEVCLSAIIMYVIVGFAGYINQVSNYWIVLALSFLSVIMVLSSVLFDPKEVREGTKVEWISVLAFFVMEAILTFCIEVLKLPYVGFFGFFNLVVQSTGLLFIIYVTVRYVLSYTRINKTIRETIKNRKASKMNAATTVVNEEVAAKVEEAIAEETAEELVETQEEVYDFTAETENETEVIGIELKEEPEISTPYMEEEM